MNAHEQNNPVVSVADGIVTTIARVLVVIFDGIKNAVDHAGPSIFGLVATLLPYVLPLPVAFMTARSVQTFFNWDPWAARVLGYGLEGLGLLAWVKLVDAVLDHVRSNNPKVSNVVILYAGVSLVYEVLLVFVNVVLAQQDGANTEYIIVLLCVCLLPALSAMLYGHQQQATNHALQQERAEAKAQAERERQERRADRKELQRLKLQYAAETAAAELENKPAPGGNFRKRDK